MYIVFFFKQKTAYEMRISDWSSDVCSSDLGAWTRRTDGVRLLGALGFENAYAFAMRGDDARARGRSEEHTSELQSLMRISYAVFCLNKKRAHKFEQNCRHRLRHQKVDT